ncbi:MAG: MFS transporter [Actinomycetota bacterium]|jgi:MFS family permease|nr:MFS transporter [Rubrobacter sp.]MDQ3509616.1 MFS transporter [Actinomycetota bacterium]
MTRPLSAVLSAFAFFGTFWGVFAVLLADLTRALDLSPGPLGVALFVGALASILSMAAFGWTSDILGRRLFIVLSAAVFGMGIVGLALAGNYGMLIAALVVLYASSGLFDVGINAAAVDVERVSGRRVMAYFHASFSAGGFLGAVSAGILLSAGLRYEFVYLIVLVPLAAIMAALVTTNFPSSGESSESSASPASLSGRYALFANGPLLLVAAIATLGLLSEGEMEHWSGIYLRETLGLSALVGGSGVAVFFGAMAVGRLGAAWAIEKFGNRATLLVAGSLTAFGMTTSLATTEPFLVVAGFLFVGLALSAVVPIAFSMAGDLAPEKAGAAVSVVTTLGYGGFLMGPVFVGGLAEVFGLRLALATISVAGVAIFILSLRLRKV